MQIYTPNNNNTLRQFQVDDMKNTYQKDSWNANVL